METVDACTDIVRAGLDLTTTQRPKGCTANRVGCTALLRGELCEHHRQQGPNTPRDRPHINNCVEQGSWCNPTPGVSALLTAGSVDQSNESSST